MPSRIIALALILPFLCLAQQDPVQTTNIAGWTYKVPPPAFPTEVKPKQREKFLERADGVGELTLHQFEVTNALLQKAEAEAYAKDSLLLKYEQFRQVPEEWAQRHCWEGINARNAYLNTPDAAEKKKRGKVVQDLQTLCGLVTIKELSANPEFAELFYLTGDALPKNFRMIIKMPIYASCDKLIGIHTAPTTNAAPSQAAWLAEFDTRYPKWIKAIGKISAENGVPQEAVEGIRCKTVTGITSAVDFYVGACTPADVRSMRHNQRVLAIKLRNMGYKVESEPAKRPR